MPDGNSEISTEIMDLSREPVSGSKEVKPKCSVGPRERPSRTKARGSHMLPSIAP